MKIKPISVQILKVNELTVGLISDLSYYLNTVFLKIGNVFFNIIGDETKQSILAIRLISNNLCLESKNI